MNTRSFLFPLLLVAMSGTQAQSLPADVGGLSAHPLTLSQRPAKALMDAALVVPEQAATQLPYGAGFETRQTGRTSGSSGVSTGGTGGSGGAGRGGSGRGR
jgi:uncharacterized membrane protein YgcG